MTEIFVGQPAKCLFCLKENINQVFGALEHEEYEDTPSFLPFPLRRILFYLSTNPRHLLAQLVKTVGGNGGDRGDADVDNLRNMTVLLCVSCHSVAERLSMFCEDLELVQMKIDYWVEGLADILSLEPEVDSNSEDGNATNQLLRDTTRTLCGKRLAKANRIVLKVHKWGQSTTSDKKPPNFIFVNLSCPFCPYETSNHKLLSLHSVCSHLDNLWSTAQLATESSQQFKDKCLRLMERESEARSCVDGHMRFQCSYCDSTHQTRNMLKVHLVDNHHSLLIPKLQTTFHVVEETVAPTLSCELPNSSFSEQNAYAIKSHSSKNGTPEIHVPPSCPHCHQTFICSRSVRRHIGNKLL